MDATKNKALVDAYREKAKELVSKMTLDEKVSQTIHPAAAIE